MTKGLGERKPTIEKLMETSLNNSLHVTFPRRKSGEVLKSTPAFVFNIDGVLYDKWRHCLPKAAQTLKYLQEKKISFVFLTNRWGDTDVEGAAWIEKTYNITGISPKQYISASSPFATLVPKFANELVLFVGLSPKRTKVMAESFGFNNVITPDEIYAAYPERYSGFVAPKLRSPRPERTQIMIKAILIFDEPKKPTQDKVLITDLLLAKAGIVGTRSRIAGGKFGKMRPNQGWQCEEQPHIWWAVEMPFRRTLERHWKSLTGRYMINNITFGKPAVENFSIADKRLEDWHHELHGLDSPKIDTVWMIGDNEKTDILGVNLYKFKSMHQWKSILVGTGVYHPGRLNGRSTVYWPSFFSMGVWDAVGFALRQDYELHWWQIGGGDWAEKSIVRL